MQIEDKLLRISEVAKQLSIAEVTLRLWIRQGRFAVVRFGRAIRIRQSEIDRMIKQGTKEAMVEGVGSARDN